MLNDFTFKEVNDVPTKTIHYSPKDRGIIDTLKNVCKMFDSLKKRVYDQQRIIDAYRETINANSDIIQTKEQTIHCLKMEISDLKITISEKNIKLSDIKDK